MNIEIFLHALVAYFVIIDPLGVLLVFHGLTSNQDSLSRRRIALHAVLLSLPLVVSFGFFGAHLLSRLGITMEAFRIAGGLLLFHTAFTMVVQPDTSSQSSKGDPSSDITVFPLTFPLMAGPGCLTLTILLFAKAKLVAGGILSATLAISIILAITLFGLLSADKIASVIGKTANAVLKRLLGVLLASLAVQFIADGVMGLVNNH
jgi:multiple antibiotic resistance protein